LHGVFQQLAEILGGHRRDFLLSATNRQCALAITGRDDEGVIGFMFRAMLDNAVELYVAGRCDVMFR
jgi:hypothetical protein